MLAGGPAGGGRLRDPNEDEEEEEEEGEEPGASEKTGAACRMRLAMR